MRDRSDDPSHHEWMLYRGCSTMELHFAPLTSDFIVNLIILRIVQNISTKYKQ